MNNTNKYILYYAAFCVSIDVLDRTTNVFQKQTGFFGKAYNFPYTDGWSLFHIAWGYLASSMDVPFKIYIPLAIANEIILEQTLCNLSKTYPIIRYSRECDSIPHMLTDILYGVCGYYIPVFLRD